MGVLARLEQRKASLEDPNTPLTGRNITLLTALGGFGPTATGRTVNQRTARKYSAVFNAITLSGGWVGALPLKLFEAQPDGGKGEVRTHPTFGVVHTRPNPRMSAMSWKEAQQAHVLTRGTLYAEIVRNNRQEAVELWPLNPDATRPRRLDDARIIAGARFDRGDLVFETIIDGTTFLLPPSRVLTVPGLGSDGLTGWSVIQMARQSIGLGLAMEEYNARFFGNASTPRGVLTMAEGSQLTPEAQDRLKESWESAQGGLDNAHRVAVLEDGVSFQQIGLSAEDAQLLEQLEWGVTETARWFNLPTSKLKQQRNEPRANVEQENISAKTDHLWPWVTRWEQALTNQLLTDRDRERGLFFEFQLQGFERGDMESRGGFYQQLFGAAAITPNEIRAKENMNPIPGGDTTFVQLQDIPLDMAGTMGATERALLKVVETGDGEAVKAVAEIRKLELLNGDAPETRLIEGTVEDTEERAVDSLLRLRTAFHPLLEDAARRMVRAEASEVRSEAGRILAEEGVEEFIAFLAFFYDPAGKMAGIIERTFAPTLRSFARAVFGDALVEIDTELPDTRLDELLEGEHGYVAKFRDSYSGASRASLEKAATEPEDFTPQETVERKLNEWTTGAPQDDVPATVKLRASKVASRELVALSEATRRHAFTAGGVQLMKWRAVGKSCPMCRRMDGKVVGVNEPFLVQGENFVGDDGETNITPKTNVAHPPLHVPGCDCIVVAS